MNQIYDTVEIQCTEIEQNVYQTIDDIYGKLGSVYDLLSELMQNTNDQIF